MYGDEKEKINLRGYIIRPADFPGVHDSSLRVQPAEKKSFQDR